MWSLRNWCATSARHPADDEPFSSGVGAPVKANRALPRRLIRGDKWKQLETIHAVRQRRLDDPASLQALVECGDQILQDEGPDTRVYLIAETLGTAPNHELTRTALLRWLDLALEQPPAESPRGWQVLAQTVLVSLRHFADDPVQRRAVDLLAHDDVQLTILAIDILGQNRYAPVLPRLIECLKSKNYHNDYAFRSSLLHALAAYPQPAAHTALVAEVPRLSGQLRHVVEQQLMQAAAPDALPGTLEIENRRLRPPSPAPPNATSAESPLSRQTPEYSVVRQTTVSTPSLHGRSHLRRSRRVCP